MEIPRAFVPIVKFFNTPIRHYGLEGEEIVDNSPRFPFWLSIIIMLVGAVLISGLVLVGFALFTK